MENTPHVAIVPSPGISHLIPCVEFAKRFVNMHNEFHVTFIIPTVGPLPNDTKAMLETFPSSLHSIVLPPVNPEIIPKVTWGGLIAQFAMKQALPSLRDALVSLRSKSTLIALVADFFTHPALDVSKEFNILSYIFFPSSATTLSLFLYMPKLDETLTCDLKDMAKPIQLPGCFPIPGPDLPQPVQDRTSDVYKAFLRLSGRFRLADGIIVNSLLEIESLPIRALQEDDKNPRIYPVGPIVRTESDGNDTRGSECLTWLDDQTQNSVLFVSFGSRGTLPQNQLNEIANGIEVSGTKFLWVLRAPSDVPHGAYFTNQKEDPSKYLPMGFLERTKNQGLVVPFWAPQIEILKHRSIGAFLTHSGWNSILESVMYGVPLIAWPLFAEQKMNAVLLTDGLKVALKPKANEEGIKGRDEIAKVIKALIDGEEGKQIRKRMEALKEAAKNALQDEGSSTRALLELGQQCKDKIGK